MTKLEIRQQRKVVYDAIVAEIAERKEISIGGSNYYNFCQSWWLKKRTGLPTAVTVRRAKELARDGFIEIDSKNTSTSTGTRYLLTDLKYPL